MQPTTLQSYAGRTHRDAVEGSYGVEPQGAVGLWKTHWPAAREDLRAYQQETLCSWKVTVIE